MVDFFVQLVLFEQLFDFENYSEKTPENDKRNHIYCIILFSDPVSPSDYHWYQY